MSEFLETEPAALDHFPTTPKDISHVTFYFDVTPEDHEDDSFYFVKVETPDSVGDDLDAWYQAALEAMIAKDPALAGYELVGAAIKYGSGRSGGGEIYYDLDNDPTDEDYAPTGGLVQGREFRSYEGGATYNYDQLF